MIINENEAALREVAQPLGTPTHVTNELVHQWTEQRKHLWRDLLFDVKRGRDVVLEAKAVGAFEASEGQFVVVVWSQHVDPDEEKASRASYDEFQSRRGTEGWPDFGDFSFGDWWGWGRGHMEFGSVEAAWDGYSDREGALQDQYRIALGLALDGPAASIELATGWERDAVLVVRGLDFYTISVSAENKVVRDHEIHDAPPKLNISVHEKALYAAISYASSLLELAESESDGIGSLHKGGDLRAAWLAREAGNTLAEQARVSFKRMLGAAVQQGTSVSELARQFHTDRANLYRLLPSDARRAPRSRRDA